MPWGSTGSASVEEGDSSRPNVSVVSPGAEAGGQLSKLQAGREHRSLQTTARSLQTHEVDRRRSIERRPASNRGRRLSSTNWQPSPARDASTDTRTFAESANTDVPTRDTITDDKMADSRVTMRRARLRSPWASSLLVVVTTALALLALFSITHSFTTKQLDCNGCRMSYMRPSFAKLSDFDTEHTRFASKYSVYLYREGMIDEDTKVPLPHPGCTTYADIR